MVFLDINTFYGPKAGGIRTYHSAKAQWFAKQDQHRYYLLYPEAANRVETLSPKAVLVAVRGWQLTGDPLGYRLLWDYWRVWVWIRRVKPDVIEAGDAWLTSFFCLFLKTTRLWKGTLISFYHSDPIPSYVLPWARRGQGQFFKKGLAYVAGKVFYGLQNRFDFTVVASETMQQSLAARSVTKIKRFPFGAPADFFLPPRNSNGQSKTSIRLLYAGRLDADKGIELLWKTIPQILSESDFQLTVAGRGAWAENFANFSHARYTYKGFVPGLSEMARLYAEHDVFLAPGPFETFGLGVLEAMAAGLMVIGPDQGGTAELLHEAKSQLIFPAHQASAFIECILKTRNPQLHGESQQNQTTAQRYGHWDEAIARMISVWE